MDLLQRLRPRWRHPDPDVRAAAVRELHDQDRLATVAREDLDPHVRKLAIRKLDSPELLQQIALDDVEPALRELAAERAREVAVRAACASDLAASEAAVARLTDERSLAAVAIGGAHEGVRRVALSRVASDRLLRDVVRNAADMGIRRAALERLGDPAALRSIAASDCPADLALLALERIQDTEALRAIAEHRGAAKEVRRRARELLGPQAGDAPSVELKDARGRQQALAIAAEALTNERDAVAAATRLRELRREWDDIASRVAPREDTGARFAAASDAVLEAAASVARREAAVEHAQSAAQATLAERRALCERVEHADGAEAPRVLADARAAWGRLPSAADAESAALARRFRDAGEACEARHRQWEIGEGRYAELAAVVADAEALAAQTPPPAMGRWRALERRWAALLSPGKSAADDLQGRFASAKERHARLHEEDAQRRSERWQENVARLESLCARLLELARAETLSLRAARRELGSAEAALQSLGPLPPGATREAWTSRLSAARDELLRRCRQEEDTEDWRRWANAGAQEEIIQRVERLLEANDLAEGTRLLGRLQDEWAQVASASPDRSQALWERFRTARNELRRRCDGYMAENLEKKRALCAQVAEVGDSTAWNETADLIKRVQAEWKAIGPVPARLAGPLWKQLREPCDRFFARRKEHWERLDAERREGLQQKTALCEQAEALADSTDWEATATAMKRLQAEWKRGGPLPRADGDKLWQRFRGACDRFFDRRSRREEIAREESLRKAEAAVAGIEELAEALGVPEPPPAESVGSKVDEAWAEWRRLDLGAGDDVQALHARLMDACRRIAASHPESLKGTRLDPAATRKRREKLCARIEELAASATAEPKTLTLQEMALALRERLATNTIAGGAGGGASSRQKAGEEAARLAASWAQLGPPLDDEARALEERFQRARAALRRE